MIKSLKSSGIDLYPHKFHTSISFKNFIEKYSHIDKDQSESEIVSIAGKVLSIRFSGKKLMFVDLYSQYQKIQVVLNSKYNFNFIISV